MTIWRCDVCGRECASRLGLVGHQRTHCAPSAKRQRRMGFCDPPWPSSRLSSVCRSTVSFLFLPTSHKSSAAIQNSDRLRTQISSTLGSLELAGARGWTSAPTVPMDYISKFEYDLFTYLRTPSFYHYEHIVNFGWQ
ncbi:hypothetical protein EG68_03432 [Paragonimus skrjabini miyazakii]|uniref:C2H2-type domain-containing protein n=1 Tax=Paragonimus skrjabini miyazakii TaxID=59628 RepID=A0A8S9Z094_9TREM|nr:hypothetical protein EG68_03432 [Paragonimus skrjabini miyazakii]